jgi:hypothetical protein
MEHWGKTMRSVLRVAALFMLSSITGCSRQPNIASYPGVTDVTWVEADNARHMHRMAAVSADALFRMGASAVSFHALEQQGGGEPFTELFDGIAPLSPMPARVFEVSARDTLMEDHDLELLVLCDKGAIVFGFKGVGQLSPAAKAYLAARLTPLFDGSMTVEAWAEQQLTSGANE